MTGDRAEAQDTVQEAFVRAWVHRGQPPADLHAVIAAITGVSAIACELGGELAALDVNPLICGSSGAVAADVLVLPRPGA